MKTTSSKYNMVNLFKREIYHNNKPYKVSLYYDFYVRGQKRVRKQILNPETGQGLYYLKSDTKIQRDEITLIGKNLVQKKRAALLANNNDIQKTLKAQKIKEESEKDKTSLMNWLDVMVERKGKKSLFNNLKSCIKVYMEYSGIVNDVDMNEINYNWLYAWRNYMIKERKMTNNSVRKYFVTLITAINKAMKFYNDEIKKVYLIPVNLAAGKLKDMEIKAETVKREYLTEQDLNKIIALPGGIWETYKQAFLFACFTGLRREEIFNLTWMNIKDGQVQRRITKTKDFAYLELSQTANDILSNVTNIQDISGKVFPGMSLKNMTPAIQKLLKSLNLNKKVFFHTARITFATMLLNNGTDLSYIQDLMNHSKMDTTLLYTKMVNEKRKSAIDKLPVLNVKAG